MPNGKNGRVRTWASVAAIVIVILGAAVTHGVLRRTVSHNSEDITKLQDVTDGLPARVGRNERDFEALREVPERLGRIEGTLEQILERLPK